MDDQDQINQREWGTPANWSGWLGSYRSARDTRVWVPKKNPAYGWTLNFAHRAAWWSLLGLSIVPMGLLLMFLLWYLAR